MAKTHRFDHKPFRIEPGSRVNLKKYNPAFTSGIKDKKEASRALLDDVSSLKEMQERLWASQSHSILIILQAMDAAGKDGTIKHVMSGVNPQGCSVHSFKAPSSEETQHHFLWRPQRFLPVRGQMCIFNRSYYEEVLVVRVHPEFLSAQGINPEKADKKFWKKRFSEINQFEKSLTDNGTVILKFFLHLSREEQTRRFIERLSDPSKLWKFSAKDSEQSRLWADYHKCYEEMLAETSTDYAPWYIIPADRKWFTRACIADIISSNMQDLKMNLPSLSHKKQAELKVLLRNLKREEKLLSSSRKNI